MRLGIAVGGWLGFIAASVLTLCAQDSYACGGCFAPPQDTSSVTGHRMAFAVSDERTVLWDQFEYSGSPEDFSWVLPIAPGAYLEEAEQGWFDALEAMTAAVVSPPNIPCASREDSGCSGEDASGRADFQLDSAINNGGVSVLFRATVGPYETVTLRSEDPDALTDWLDAGGYVVPAGIESVIAEYVSEGADFLALKLAPGKDVQQMTPVRVVTPSGDPILPLRMVAAGVRDEVDIVLYVIAEGRFTIPDLEPVELDLDQLSWDFNTQDSNYEQLRDRTLREHDGRTVLTTFASPLGGDNGVWTSLLANYAALPVDPNQPSFGPPPPRCSTFSDPVRALLGSNGVVSDACYGQLEIPAPVACNETDDANSSAVLVCGEGTDFAAAMVGMRPGRTWLTRLEMTLPRSALNMDCAVEKIDNEQVSNRLTARRFEGPPPCEPALFTASVSAEQKPPLSVWVLGLAGALVLSRRLRTNRKSSS